MTYGNTLTVTEKPSEVRVLPPPCNIFKLSIFALLTKWRKNVSLNSSSGLVDHGTQDM